MLVIDRKYGQEVWVTAPSGEVIKFVVNHVSGNRVKVGVGAPRGWRIDRPESEAFRKRTEEGRVDG